MRLLAIVLAVASAILLLWAVARLLSEDETIGEPPTQTSDTEYDGEAWRFIEPSPTPVIGLHEYAAPLRAVPTATPTPTPVRPTSVPATAHTSSGSGTRTIHRVHGFLRGYATWYATGRSGFYAAAGPALRKAIGPGWRGTRVLVARAGTRFGVEVKLIDWCACGKRHGVPTLLDLSDEAFNALAPLSRGVIRIAVDIP